MTDVEAEQPEPPELVPPRPAGPGSRIGCAALELLLVGLCLGVGWVIWWVALWPRASTPARSLLHLELVRADGAGRPPTKRAAARDLAAKLLLPLAPVSALVWLAGRRGLWDRLTGTTVAAA